MNPIHKFTPPNIAKKLNKINQNLSASHQKPFPKANFLSQYSFQKRFVGIEPNGDIQGGYAGMVASLIDFSFVRSMVADAYSIFGPPCYDPVTLFLLDLFRYIDDYRDMNAFLEVVRDERRGKDYRDYAGILEDIPSEGTFSNFRERIGEQRHNDIFHGMVGIFHDLEMITFKILSHDGTLYPSWARYKGCTYFCDQCASIRVPDVRSKIKAAVIRRLNAKNNLDSEIRVKVDCPSDRFPKNSEIRIPKIEVFSLKLAFVDGATTTEQNNNAAYFDLHDELRKQALCIQTLRSNIDNFTDDGSIIIACEPI